MKKMIRMAAMAAGLVAAISLLTSAYDMESLIVKETPFTTIRQTSQYVEGLCYTVCSYADGSTFEGYLDTDCNQAITLPDDTIWADDFSEGYAVVRMDDGSYHYIDQNGNWVTQFGEWDYTSAFHDGYAAVLDGNYSSIMDTSGNLVLNLEAGYHILGYSDGVLRIYYTATDGN